MGHCHKGNQRTCALSCSDLKLDKIGPQAHDFLPGVIGDLHGLFSIGAEGPIITVQTTVETDSLPSFLPESSRKSAPTYKPSQMPSANFESLIYTVAMSADPRCPYPYPGIYCGKQKTTLVTNTKNEEATTTQKHKEPLSDRGATRTRVIATRTLILVMISDIVLTSVAGSTSVGARVD
ncbi:Nn.00g100600.m01.CDS01 [Neocucurbitaria sp. VM-36]